MNKTLVIVADAGLLRAYRETQDITYRQSHLELIEEFRPETAHQKLSDQATNQAGRFPSGGGGGNISGDLSAGEYLIVEAEQERQFISQLAGRISVLLADNAVTSCSLAISGAIHNQLLEGIDPKARAKICRDWPSAGLESR